MYRKYNFSAGPAMLPEAVLKKAQEELPNWHGSGASIMEMSHRGKEFVSVYEEAEKDVRELLDVPKNYKVLFLQGGATAQFATCLLYTSPSPRDRQKSRMPSSA